MKNSPVEEKISWVQVWSDLETLAKQIPKGKYSHIIAVGKGGMIPAYFLSKYLGIDSMQIMVLSSYKNRKKGNIEMVGGTFFSMENYNNPSVLVVDDLVDTGDSLKFITDLVPGAATAVLYKKAKSPKPTYSVADFTGWLVFPWELPNF